MTKLDNLYYQMLNAEVNGDAKITEAAEPHLMQCLENPEEEALVWRVKPCICPPGKDSACESACAWDAVSFTETTGISIDKDKCVGCGACIDACKIGALQAGRDLIPVLRDLHSHDGHVYALVAPAFSGQFGEKVTAGRLRTALKKTGFSGMIEVAAFADILTFKEALEFDERINSESDFQLTSCCCPMWIAMIRKQFHTLLPNVPGAVSPMIAAGRVIKVLYPDAVTVFIGPCMAKKAERREPDIADAVDHVITFQELRDLFEATDIDFDKLEEENVPHASASGIRYARCGGVAEAVAKSVDKLDPDREIKLKARHADGVPDCRAMIQDLMDGKLEGNFFEGMGCKGGCVGGPKAIIPKEEGEKCVNAYSDEAGYETPMENPHVIELIKRLGFETVEEFLKNSTMFNRNFD